MLNKGLHIVINVGMVPQVCGTTSSTQNKKPLICNKGLCIVINVGMVPQVCGTTSSNKIKSPLFVIRSFAL